MTTKYMSFGACALALITISSTSYASNKFAQASSDFVFDKDQYQAALPDILEFSELVHRVRYYYPSHAVSNTQWEDFLEHSISKMVEAPTTQRLETGLSLLKKVAPHIYSNSNQLPTFNDTDVVNTWINIGARTMNGNFRVMQTFEYGSISSWDVTSKRDVYADVYAGQSIYWPLYLEYQQGLSGQAYTSSNLGTSLASPPKCMAALSMIWGEINHFWPYFEQVPVNWKNSHENLLTACTGAAANIEREVQREFTKLQDNHLFIMLPEQFSKFGDYRLPLDLEYIDGKAILSKKTHYLTLQADIGDELIAIDDVSIEDLINAELGKTFRSPHVEKRIAVSRFHRSYKTPELVKLTFKKLSGEIFTTTTGTVHKDVMGPLHDHLPEQPLLADLGDGVVLFRLFKMADEAELEQAVEALKSAKGIVLDMRNYPSNFSLTLRFLSYFTDKLTTVGPFIVAAQRLPEQADSVVLSEPPRLPDTEKLFNVPTVVMSERKNQSAGEHMLMFVQSMGFPIIGEVTSGINGDIMVGEVFKGDNDSAITYVYTSKRSDQVDGSKLIGVGIQPDHLVPVTQLSFATNNDIQLEKARQVLDDMMGN
ncbi:S41 family peptidase [Pseudoalteromonas luteoviolacea]|uniref:S41 family peptidase n=1 Tax=Pseudoalteromonas luteoviolacea TaxID=43657 RepID=UPI001EEE8FBA|nr:S41 family peptidase [Pseudoalteromonas luteoviolacea]MCF6439140.1 S41 family peptidase [Pseudoalteromonas luteoviolacea]